MTKKCLQCNSSILGYQKSFCSKQCYKTYRSNNTNLISKEELINLYVNQKKSIVEIITIYKSSYKTIKKYLDKYEIPLRDHYVDYTGLIIGNVTVLYLIDKEYKNGEHRKWKCLCKCGKECIKNSNTLSYRRTDRCLNCKRASRIYTGLIANYIYNEIKYQAHQRKIEFNLSKEYLENLFKNQNGKCKISGVDIHFPSNSKKRGNASLDRIDSNKPYIEGNVQWVHKTVNYMKRNMTDQELTDWCKVIYLHTKGEN